MQIIIQNLPNTNARGVKTQYGGDFIHIHGTGTTIRQAAYDALALMPEKLFMEWAKVVGKMILDLKDNGQRGQYGIRISIPHQIGPRQYLNGKYHPGKPDTINDDFTIAVQPLPSPSMPLPVKGTPGRPRKTA